MGREVLAQLLWCGAEVPAAHSDMNIRASASGGLRGARLKLCPPLLAEIEMVIMERSKLSELAASASAREQNTTDEEKSAAAATCSDSTQWSR
jgi:hypothetical protein